MLDLDGAPLHVDEASPDGPAVTEKDPHHVAENDLLDRDTVGRERDELKPLMTDFDSTRCVAVNDTVRKSRSVSVTELDKTDSEAEGCVSEGLRELEPDSLGEIVGEREFHIREAVVIATPPSSLLVAEPAPSGGTIVRFMHNAYARRSASKRSRKVTVLIQRNTSSVEEMMSNSSQSTKLQSSGGGRRHVKVVRNNPKPLREATVAAVWSMAQNAFADGNPRAAAAMGISGSSY